MADLIEPGWSSEAARSGPRQAALLAMAAEPVPPVSYVKLESSGVVLICGRDGIAVEAGNLLKDHLDVTVLIAPPAAIAPRSDKLLVHYASTLLDQDKIEETTAAAERAIAPGSRRRSTMTISLPRPFILTKSRLANASRTAANG